MGGVLGALLLVASQAATVWYTVPNRPAVEGRCDNLVIRCDSLTGICDTTVVEWDEECSWTEVWWKARWADGDFLRIREKYVHGLEGRRDSVEVPADTAATIFLTWRDAAGNRTCQSKPRTVGIPPVAVSEGTTVWRRAAWYDVQGRRLGVQHELGLEAALRRTVLNHSVVYDGIPSGLYFRREITPARVAVRRVVVMR